MAPIALRAGCRELGTRRASNVRTMTAVRASSCCDAYDPKRLLSPCKSTDDAAQSILKILEDEAQQLSSRKARLIG
jgi:hypothetical protein